jgi:hypothetical protein
MSSVCRVQLKQYSMTGLAPISQSQDRRDSVIPVEVLSLYADPIRPQPAAASFASLPGCRVFMHPTDFLGHYTHRVTWVSGICQVDNNSERCLR